MAKHPAKYSDAIIKKLALLLTEHNCKRVLDPFAGTGKLAFVKYLGFQGIIVCNDIEPDWKEPSYPVDAWYHRDAANLPFADGEFDCICTSPTYGNRLADKNKGRSNDLTYTTGLGHSLHPSNTGILQWGQEYKAKHLDVYQECYRVLAENGLFILNISNHIRDKLEVPVSEWHRNVLTKEFGLRLLEDCHINTPRFRRGAANVRDERVAFEHIYVMRKEA